MPPHPDIARLEAQNRDIFILLRQEAEERVKISHTLVRIEERLRLQKDCPNPGLCLELKPTVNTLVKDMEQIRGGWKIIGGLIAASSAVGAFVGYFFPRR